MQGAEAYQRCLTRLVREWAVDFLILMTDVAATLALPLKGQSAECVVPFPDLDICMTASDKVCLIDIATAIEVPVPSSIRLDSIAAAEDAVRFGQEAGLPVLVNPHRSSS